MRLFARNILVSYVTQDYLKCLHTVLLEYGGIGLHHNIKIKLGLVFRTVDMDCHGTAGLLAEPPNAATPA